MKKKAQKIESPKEPTSCIETFRDCRGWSLDTLKASEPSCFNGEVRVVKFRVSVEQIPEPLDVIHARLIKLWRECENYHHYQPLMDAAKLHGLNLDSKDYGVDRKRITRPPN